MVLTFGLQKSNELSVDARHPRSVAVLHVKAHISFDIPLAERGTFIVRRFSAAETERELDLTAMRIQGKGD